MAQTGQASVFVSSSRICLPCTQLDPALHAFQAHAEVNRLHLVVDKKHEIRLNTAWNIG